jgi:hypothetical protein
MMRVLRATAWISLPFVTALAWLAPAAYASLARPSRAAFADGPICEIGGLASDRY